MKWIIGAGIAAGLSLLLWPRATSSKPIPALTTITPVKLLKTNASAQTQSQTAAISASSNPSVDTTNKLTLHIVTADGGKPVPMVELDYWVWELGEVYHKKSLHADRFGVCYVPVPRSTVTKLIMVSKRNGFADTRLQWHADQGQIIPQEYTLRLSRALTIGGTVVDADGNPVAGAKIGLNNRPDPANELLTETANFGWPFWIETTSDSSGHWKISRIGKDALTTLDGSADHPQHLMDQVLGGPDTEKQMLAEAYIFHLGRGVEVHGEVTDSLGRPIAGSRVRVGYAGMMDTRKGKTGHDGKFSVGGCKPEKTPITADAKGFATATIEVDLTTNVGPFHLSLQSGKMIHLRVVDGKGDAISNVWVHLNNAPDFNAPAGKKPAIQADFNKETDGNGRVEWDSAPDDDLKFDAVATGYMRGTIHFRPDEQEHVITLTKGITLFGSVRDATTGQPLPAFRIIVGYPGTNVFTGEVIDYWSTLDRLWLKFEGGKFRHLFDEPALGGANPGFVFKFEADGYSPFVSPIYAGSEGEVELNAALHPAATMDITVLLPDGEPAAKADVGLVSSSSHLQLRPGGITRMPYGVGESLLTTDDRGHFSLPADESVKQIVIAHPDGLAQTTLSQLVANSTVQLEPWSRLEGTLIYNGEPAAGRDVLLQWGNGNYQSISSDQKYRATTDSSGQFVFPQAPPGHQQLVLLVPFEMGPGRHGWSHSPLTNLDLSPGQTLTVTTTVQFPPEMRASMQPIGNPVRP